MKAIFLCENETHMFGVYDEKSFEKLQKLTGIEKIVYKKSDVIEKSEEFYDVEYIFSTWGMPAFEEEEIKRCFPNLKCVFYGGVPCRNLQDPF